MSSDHADQTSRALDHPVVPCEYVFRAFLPLVWLQLFVLALRTELLTNRDEILAVDIMVLCSPRE